MVKAVGLVFSTPCSGISEAIAVLMVKVSCPNFIEVKIKARLQAPLWKSSEVPTLLGQTKKQLAKPNGSDPPCRYPARYGGLARPILNASKLL